MISDQRVSARWLTQHVHENIPLSKTMQFEVLRLAGSSLTIAAPLQPNINVHGTGFAGSLYSLAVLAAWSLTSVFTRESGILADVVVSKAEIEYRRPVKVDIRCQCSCDAEIKATFIETLQTKGKARLFLKVIIGDSEEALLKASMVAVKHS